MPRLKQRLPVLILAFSLSAPAVAEVYSLEQTLRQALVQNPELLANGEQARAALSRAAGARGALWPQLGLRYLARRSDNPLDAFADKLNTRVVNPATDFTGAALNYPDPSTIHATELAVSWPLYTGGRVSAVIRQADEHSEAARLDHERRQQLLVHRTRAAYFVAQAAQLGVAIADDAARAAREHAQTTARLTREGRSVTSDQMTAELTLANIESTHEQALRRHEQALDELKLLMGLAPQAEVELTPWQPPMAVAPMALGELETRAFEARKDLHAARAQQNAARARIDEAQAAFLPQFGVVAANNWYADSPALDNKSQSIMGVVSINLFSGGRDRHEVGAARHLAAESNARQQALEQAIRAELHAAYRDLTSARARLGIATQTVDKARVNVALVKKRYGEGRTILLDLLMAERLLVDTRNEELSAALLVKTSESALRLADGTLELPQ
jgi:outer membrane protein TolC